MCLATILPGHEQPAESTAATRHPAPSGRYLAVLAGVLLLSLAIRLYGLGWGIPAYDPEVLARSPYRHSYHIDEDNILWGLMQMRPAEGSFDVKDYHWGTLQHYLVYGALLAGSAVGYIPAPWEAAFEKGDTTALPRIYMAGRLVSVVAGTLATLAVIALGARLGGRSAGLAAGLAYALAPVAVAEAHYLTNDITMSALVAASLLSGLHALNSRALRWLLLAGLLLGLAVAAKYSAVFAAPGMVAAQVLMWRGPRSPGALEAGRTLTLAVAPWLAAILGFFIGEPYAFIYPQKLIAGLEMASRGNAWPAGVEPTLPLRMIGWQLENLGAHGLTWPLFALAVLGIVFAAVQTWQRRRYAGSAAGTTLQGSTLVLGFAILGLILGLALNRVPMLRYSQPLVPLLCAIAGFGWAAMPRRSLRVLAGILTVAVAGTVTLGQLSLFAGPHSANSLLLWLGQNLRDGQQVARLWPEYPLLDDTRYNLIRLDPWRAELPPGASPDYIIMDDMALGPPAAELAALLEAGYVLVAVFGAQPSIGAFTWSEGTTPHDWKYSHPTFTVYARR